MVRVRRPRRPHRAPAVLGAAAGRVDGRLRRRGPPRGRRGDGGARPVGVGDGVLERPHDLRVRGARFELDGGRWANVEAYFQGAKSRGTPDHAAALRAITADPSPESAFRVGRTRAIRPDWEAVKRDVMRAALTAKFTQSDDLRALLLSTGDAPLVQLKPGDAYWGTGPDGRGANHLGALLMELRASLRRA
ncbi:MAG: NADAR family protein [Polyangiales bacterium]